jgi:N-acetylglutamate synthase-like GNAT family acetyltransferase
MSPDVTIRPAAHADIDAVRALLIASDLPDDGLDEQFGDGYAVAVSNGAIVGAEGIEVYGTDGLLRSAAIAPAWGGRGLGDALTRDRIAWSRRRHLSALYLLTTTAADYFPRFGFSPVSRDIAPAAIRESREFSSACPGTAVFMHLPLGSKN